MKKSYSISPSTLKIFEDCPRCFWLHFNKKIKRPAQIFPSLPSGVDKVLKEYYNSYRNENKLPPELSSLEKDNVKLFNDYEKLDEWRNFQKGLKWENKKGGFVRGALDDLLEKDNKLIVLDYKTRGYPLKEDTAGYYKMQLEVYTLLLNKNGYETEDYGYLIFYHPKQVESSRLILFDTDLVKVEVSVENAENFVNDAFKVLKGKIPESSEKCGFCKWAKDYL